MIVYYLAVLTLFLQQAQGHVDYQPQQVHIALGESEYDIVVTWSTMDDALDSLVEYGPDGRFSMNATGTATKFVDGGAAKHSQFIHTVMLPNLLPDTRYVYHCGGKLGWSAEFWFTTLSNDTSKPVQVAIFGDMGNENAQSMAMLQEDTQRDMYDLIVHVGDFAYDMNSENAEVGDQFMRQIETLAAYVPYMVCAGNHEEAYNFSNYRARFSMPGNTDNMMYSFDVGPVHFIGISTEFYYFMNYGLKPLVNQYAWLERDLAEATKPENRALRPWIITFGHRPMYCSNENDNDCTHSQTLVRVGLPFTHFFGLEDLFYKYAVDVEIWAHEHSYERLWPIYDYKVYNGSTDKPYTNPGAPIHLVTGSAGCKEGREPFKGKIPEWSAFHSRDYGYTRMKAFNTSHLYFEQISVDKKGVIDSFWVVKDEHKQYSHSKDEF